LPLAPLPLEFPAVGGAVGAEQAEGADDEQPQ
jgi:hypothetical protein